MAKIKIGELYNKPIVKGDRNLVENHEIYVDDLISGSQGESTTNELKRNDVNFFDYDGTLLYAYSWEEAKNLTALPALPTHDGLEVREWNYTLEDIKEQEGISYMINGKSCMYIETASADGVEYEIYTNIDYRYDYYAIKATDIKEIGTKCVGCRFYNDELSLSDTSIYYIEKIFTSIGKVDVGACVYDSSGNQVKVLGVYIYERNMSEFDFNSYYQELVEVFSIPASLSNMTYGHFYDSLFLQELKIPKNANFANDDYDTFDNVQANNAYMNGAGRAYFDKVYPLQVFNIPDNTISIPNIPWGCVMNMPESILKITSSFYSEGGGEMSTFLNFTKAKNIPSIEAPEFENEKLLYVVVPDELYNEWINSTNWSSIANSIYKHSDVPWLK